ncbi:SigE family RNA polymerase sigma factor [Jiangella anatolica]|uniref:SigE family RNA polymerase sigma factor n=1 Tax=Jiangella anatolica TaxID=2670374 RepID=UPI001314F46D|nr:SigE family RNA polymerase sigma factor [Jiangella anatolica]
MERSTSQSFEEWARADGVQLRRAALLLTGNAHDADDLVQDTLVRVFAKWPRVRTMENRGGYARRVLINRHLSLGRRLQRLRARQNLMMGGDPAAEAPRDAAIDAQADLRRALLTLGPRQRAVVVLRYYLDLPDAQVAEILNCSPATVRSQAHRALATLRNSVEIGAYNQEQGR